MRALAVTVAFVLSGVHISSNLLDTISGGISADVVGQLGQATVVVAHCLIIWCHVRILCYPHEGGVREAIRVVLEPTLFDLQQELDEEEKDTHCCAGDKDCSDDPACRCCLTHPLPDAPRRLSLIHI